MNDVKLLQKVTTPVMVAPKDFCIFSAQKTWPIANTLAEMGQGKSQCGVMEEVTEAGQQCELIGHV